MKLKHAAITIALCHFTFNLVASIIVHMIKPLRLIPIILAQQLGNMVSRSRTMAISYIILLFYAILLSLIVISNLLKKNLGGKNGSTGDL
jgi:hypothetical protein